MLYIKTSTAMGTDAAQGFREPGQMLMPNSSLDLNLLGSLGFMNFLWKRKLLSFIMWTSQEDVWGSSWFSRSNCSSTARAFGGVFDAERLALTEALCVCVCVVHTVQRPEWAKWVYPALHWANNKKKKDTKAIYRSPSTNNGGVRLFVCNSACNTEDMLKIAKLALSNACLLINNFIFHTRDKISA